MDEKLKLAMKIQKWITFITKTQKMVKSGKICDANQTVIHLITKGQKSVKFGSYHI